MQNWSGLRAALYALMACVAVITAAGLYLGRMVATGQPYDARLVRAVQVAASLLTGPLFVPVRLASWRRVRVSTSEGGVTLTAWTAFRTWSKDWQIEDSSRSLAFNLRGPFNSSHFKVCLFNIMIFLMHSSYAFLTFFCFAGNWYLRAATRVRARRLARRHRQRRGR